MGTTAIRVEKLSKMYRIGAKESQPQTRADAIRRAALSPLAYLRRTLRPPREEEIFWALRDVSFEVKRGEVVGIIGRNGAGKSTLLKILSRITEPTSGRAVINGRVGSLLEVGTGFHPELTGRENIYLNGTMLGMKGHEITKKFDEIVDFSGVEKFINTPVKRYSSGMYVRLAFAVAAHLEPEILIVDEVLAVGDAEFQKKCLGKMGEVAEAGRTVLFVSHNMGAIRHLCNSAVLLKNGTFQASGDVDSVVQCYLTSFQDFFSLEVGSSLAHHDSYGISLEGIALANPAGEPVSSIETGSPAIICLSIKTEKAYPNCLFALTIDTMDDIRVCAFHNEIIGTAINIAPPGCTIRCRVNNLNLFPGMYRLTFKMRISDETIFYLPKSFSFYVENSNIYGTGKIPERSWGGICLLEHAWDVIPLQTG
jgi:lipopolysaccharide transport system ATP-binding protein